MPKNLTRAAAREALVRLSAHFAVPVPKLRWSRYYRGFYNDKTHTISMGRKIRAGNQQALLHEFAHHLTVIRGGVHYYYHREPFVSCLIEITTFWYGDPEKYNWEEEYFSVMNAAYEILSRKYKEAYAKARA